MINTPVKHINKDMKTIAAKEQQTPSLSNRRFGKPQNKEVLEVTIKMCLRREEEEMIQMDPKESKSVVRKTFQKELFAKSKIQ